MRNRERFNANVDESAEQSFSKRITSIKKLIKKLNNNLTETVASIEPCEHQLMWGSLRRCLVGIESAIALVSQGYIGTANAILRQIMEFLMWSKLGLDADEKTLKKLNEYFYDNSLGKSHPVTYILKKTKIEDFDENIKGKDLETVCKKMYHNYSFLTHATGIAQQCPYKSESFYSLLNGCLNEICILLDAFLSVYKQYCNRLIEEFYKQSEKTGYDILNLDSSNEKERQYGFLWVASINSGKVLYKICGYHNTIIKTQGNIVSDLQFAFSSKWIIDGEKLK